VSCFLEGEGQGVAVAEDYLSGDRVNLFLGWPSHLPLDVAFATIAHSAPFVGKLENVGLKCYLVQDFEAWFNPVGDAYTVAENSYTHGLIHFTIGNWLTHVIRNQYGGRALPAGLGVDTSIYKVLPDAEREKAISFLYQPEKPRRNPQLAISALRLVKEKHPDVKIVVYGSDAPLGLDFEVENLGLVRSLEKLNEIYNRCSVGLCLSMSNPSRIPFEMMAAGCVPVDVYRYNNLLDYEGSTVKLAYQSPESLAEAMCQLLEKRDELEKRRAQCIDYASSRSLDWENSVMSNAVMAMLRGSDLPEIAVELQLTEHPVIGVKEATKEARAYCAWQRRLAGG
jgi:glycosyltransferase involved in cell wall biosynthesis